LALRRNRRPNGFRADRRSISCLVRHDVALIASDGLASLGGTHLSAGYLPARLDPMIALRDE
jgi:hypothetical protein